jgi:hypothetical protein
MAKKTTTTTKKKKLSTEQKNNLKGLVDLFSTHNKYDSLKSFQKVIQQDKHNRLIGGLSNNLIKNFILRNVFELVRLNKKKLHSIIQKS